jgi:toxin-antitoxin system PIN domain toxin
LILCDVNLLVYAYDSSSPFHSDAKKWWEETVRSGKAIGLPWEVTSGFLRLVTHPKVFARPLAVDRALDIVNSWFEQPNVTPLNPGPRHWQHFS